MSPREAEEAARALIQSIYEFSTEGVATATLWDLYRAADELCDGLVHEHQQEWPV